MAYWLLLTSFILLSVFQIVAGIGGGPVVAAYGLRTNFLHLPLIFVIPQVFSQGGARAGGRQHDGAQAVGHHALGEHGADGRADGRVPAARRVQRGLRRPGHRPRPRLDPVPAMVSITGSVRAGKEVAAAAAADLKRVHLQLGGKAPVVVFDDADVAKWIPN